MKVRHFKNYIIVCVLNAPAKTIVQSIGNRQNVGNVYKNAEKLAILVTKWPLILFSAYLTFVLVSIAIYTIVVDMLLGTNEPKMWFRMFKMR